MSNREEADPKFVHAITILDPEETNCGRQAPTPSFYRDLMAQSMPACPECYPVEDKDE